MDDMTPDQRAAAVNERIITDLDLLSEEFRRTVVATTRRLASDRTPPPAT
jgi:hypothetical protein